ncbi:MAG: hypothetical protein R3B49_04825 [Phycisphaerales bacterium]
MTAIEADPAKRRRRLPAQQAQMVRNFLGGMLESQSLATSARESQKSGD